MAAANSLTLGNGNFTGVTGSVIRVNGGNAGNTVNASGAANRVIMVGGAGKDMFTGGAGSDIFMFTAATLAATDTVVGGGGNDYLDMTTAGTVAAGGVSGVEVYELANGAANSLSLVERQLHRGDRRLDHGLWRDRRQHRQCLGADRAEPGGDGRRRRQGCVHRRRRQRCLRVHRRRRWRRATRSRAGPAATSW